LPGLINRIGPRCRAVALKATSSRVWLIFAGGPQTAIGRLLEIEIGGGLGGLGRALVESTCLWPCSTGAEPRRSRWLPATEASPGQEGKPACSEARESFEECPCFSLPHTAGRNTPAGRNLPRSQSAEKEGGYVGGASVTTEGDKSLGISPPRAAGFLTHTDQNRPRCRGSRISRPTSAEGRLSCRLCTVACNRSRVAYCWRRVATLSQLVDLDYRTWAGGNPERCQLLGTTPRSSAVEIQRQSFGTGPVRS